MYSIVGRRSTTAETTAAAAHLGVTTRMFFSHSLSLVVRGTFLRVLYNDIHHNVAFARELEVFDIACLNEQSRNNDGHEGSSDGVLSDYPTVYCGIL